VSQRTGLRFELPSTPTEQAGKTNRTAIWALVLSVLTLGGIGSLLGIVLGAKARRRAMESGQGRIGVATAAIIIGAVTLLASLGYWGYFIADTSGGSY
jgi:hypothetical protein